MARKGVVMPKLDNDTPLRRFVEGHSSTNGYRVGFTARELQTMVFPEPTFVVDGLITPGLTFLVSRPKLGKSWWALDVAIAIATGQPALGSATVEQGDVLCLALEDSA